MIDDSDGDMALMASLFAPTFGGALVLLIIAWLLYGAAAKNADECSKRVCPQPTQTARLMNHECLCVEVATQAK